MMVEMVKGKTSRFVLQVVLVCAVSNEGKLLKENFTLLTFSFCFTEAHHTDSREKGLKTLQRRNLNNRSRKWWIWRWNSTVHSSSLKRNFKNTHTLQIHYPRSLQIKCMSCSFLCCTGLTYKLNTLCYFCQLCARLAGTTHLQSYRHSNPAPPPQNAPALSVFTHTNEAKTTFEPQRLRPQSVSAVMNSRVDDACNRLGQLFVWPQGDVISQNSPANFKHDFPTTFPTPGSQTKREGRVICVDWQWRPDTSEYYPGM